MEKMIVYPRADGGLVYVMPATNCGISVSEIARKDVPSGQPFLIVDTADLPEDYRYIDAWTADFSQPDGFGIGAEAWFAERAAAEALAAQQAAAAELAAQQAAAAALAAEQAAAEAALQEQEGN